jgi:outer membrane protein TolC
MELAEEHAKVAAAQLVELEQKWREGLVDSSELLDVTAQRDTARMQAINARFRYQVGAATLLNVMGKTKIDYEEPEHEGAS